MGHSENAFLHLTAAENMKTSSWFLKIENFYIFYDLHFDSRLFF